MKVPELSVSHCYGSAFTPCDSQAQIWVQRSLFGQCIDLLQVHPVLHTERVAAGHLSGVLYRRAFFWFNSLVKQSACVIPVPDNRSCWDGILERIIQNHQTYHRCTCYGHRSTGKCILGKTTGGPVVQLDLKSGRASTVGQVTPVPVQNSMEISKDRDSPTSLGKLCVHIHYQSGFPDLHRYETIETSGVLWICQWRKRNSCQEEISGKLIWAIICPP